MAMDKIKEKAKNLKDSAKEKMDAAKTKTEQFFEEHEEAIPGFVTFGITVLPVVLATISAVIGNNNERCLVEDDVTGLDFKTKHPMTNKEILELSDRMIDGQSKGNALNDMGLLKKERKRR